MTAPVSSVQLADLRRRETATMTDLADIISRTRVSDNAGGSLLVVSTQSDVPCRRSPNLAGNTETQFGGQLVSGLQWLFVFPYGTEITTDDEVVYLASNEHFAVMGVLGPRTLELCRRIICVEK